MKKGLGVDGGVERLCLRLGFGGIPPAGLPGTCPSGRCHKQINNDFAAKTLAISEKYRIFAPETYKQQRL